MRTKVNIWIFLCKISLISIFISAPFLINPDDFGVNVVAGTYLGILGGLCSLGMPFVKESEVRKEHK